MARKGLGRGLNALIPEMGVADREKEKITTVWLRDVRPNPRQPRKLFDDDRLAELADSIREHGIVQPIVVRPQGDEYEIVAGERRWRAAKLAGFEKVPALVRSFSEAETMEIALIENLQREDLNPLEEAEAYRTLMDEFKLTQDELGKRLGKSRPQIANTLRLHQLGSVAKAELRAGRLSMGHAKVLLGIESEQQQNDLVRRAVAGGYSVRQLEGAARRPVSVLGTASRKSSGGLTSDLAAVERRLGELFGTPVKLTVGEQRGRIEITFFGEEGLERILETLKLSEERAPLPPQGAFRI